MREKSIRNSLVHMGKFVVEILFFCLMLSACNKEETTVNSLNTSFKDQELLSYLLKYYDTNGDGELSIEEAAQVKSLSIGHEITSTDGIECLTSLESLWIENNKIRELNLGNMPKMKSLTIWYADSLQTIRFSSDNILQTLQCISCPALETGIDFYNQLGNLSHLCCDTTFMKEVKLNMFPKLSYFEYRGNSCFDVSDNHTLDTLVVSGVIAGKLVVKNADLRYLSLEGFENVTVEGCPYLSELRSTPKILSIRNCSALKELLTHSNQLAIEDCKQLEHLEAVFTATPEVSLKGLENLKEVKFTGKTFDPNNPNLPQSLPDILWSDFPLLENLTLDGNLSCLDLSQSKQLKELNILNSGLRFLDISNHSELKTLICIRHRLNIIDASNCSQLDSCYLNAYQLPPRTEYAEGVESFTLRKLNLDGCLSLKYLEMGDTQLESLDVSSTKIKALTVKSIKTDEWGSDVYPLKELKINPDMEDLICSYNQLETLDLSQSNLVRLDIHKGRVRSLKVNPSMKCLLCNDNAINSLDLSDCRQLDTLDVSHNNLTNLALVGMPNLKSARFDFNPITVLRVEDCTNLKAVDLNENTCKMVNISGCANLQGVSINCLDYEIAGCPSLTYLYLYNVNKGQIEIRDLPSLQHLILNCSNATSVVIRNLPQLEDFNVFGNANLQDLRIKDLPKLTEAIIMENVNLTAFSMVDSPLLGTLRLSNLDRLSTLDLSSYPNLSLFYCTGCDLLATLDFTKNALNLSADCRGNRSLKKVYLNPNQSVKTDSFTELKYVY